jgi:hypothetical protein
VVKDAFKAVAYRPNEPEETARVLRKTLYASLRRAAP